MSDKEAIFIFTRDRPQVLSKTLNSLQDTIYRKHVIDDSHSISNRKAVRNLCARYPNVIYLGESEFDHFVIKHNINFPEFNFLLRKVGDIEWNLGYARNFALLYAKSKNFEKVLFSDDDIHVPRLKLIDELFQSIKDYQFVGANISGLVDDSILGHIATEIGILNERMLSGGFMIFDPRKIDQYFLNNYNEDWIWLFLQLNNRKYLQTGEVFQQLSNPLESYKNKVLFQEFGEIALDGILEIYKDGSSHDELSQISFWERMLKERLEYLNLLTEKAIAANKQTSIEIIKFIIDNRHKFEAITFKNLFEKFFYNRNFFQKLYKSLS
jgi:hypothetical protein